MSSRARPLSQFLFPEHVPSAVSFAPPGTDTPLVSPLRLNYSASLAQKRQGADVAQLVEHLICNQAVASSILAVSSLWGERPCVATPDSADQRGAVGYPSGQREQTVNLSANAFEGSNPSPTMGSVSAASS